MALFLRQGTAALARSSITPQSLLIGTRLPQSGLRATSSLWLVGREEEWFLKASQLAQFLHFSTALVFLRCDIDRSGAERAVTEQIPDCLEGHAVVNAVRCKGMPQPMR